MDPKCVLKMTVSYPFYCHAMQYPVSKISFCCSIFEVQFQMVFTCVHITTPHQAPVPLGLSINGITLHWHNVNVNKMSTLLNLRPTNAGDILLTFPLATDVSKRFIGRDGFHTHWCCREQPFRALWRHISESTSFYVDVSRVFHIDFQAS